MKWFDEVLTKFLKNLVLRTLKYQLKPAITVL